MKKIIIAGIGVTVLIATVLLYVRDKEEVEEISISSTAQSSGRIVLRPELTEKTSESLVLEESQYETETSEEEIAEESAIESSEPIVEKEFVPNEETMPILLEINEQFFSAYYGQGNRSERNQQLAAVLSKELMDIYTIPEEGEVNVEEYSVKPYVGAFTETNGEIVNIVDVVFSTFPTKMIVTIMYDFIEEWQITDIVFELIQQ